MPGKKKRKKKFNVKALAHYTQRQKMMSISFLLIFLNRIKAHTETRVDFKMTGYYPLARLPRGGCMKSNNMHFYIFLLWGILLLGTAITSCGSIRAPGAYMAPEIEANDYGVALGIQSELAPAVGDPGAYKSIPELKRKQIQALAASNGFYPKKRVVNAIIVASETYSVDHLEMTAIGILETGLGKYTQTNNNANGTKDLGLFQINTVNFPKCIEYNLESPEGSALCAAKILSKIKAKRPDYLGAYHSKTPSIKESYMKKLEIVMARNDND